ncbi:MAG: type II toxin-antitoxin system HicB family antitoxin, partial [Candidatus Rokuibacteriota bacterium]
MAMLVSCEKDVVHDGGPIVRWKRRFNDPLRGMGSRYVAAPIVSRPLPGDRYREEVSARGPEVPCPWHSFHVSRPGLDAYKIVLYRQDDGSWVAEVPAISGCYALMATREEALA